MPPVTQLSRQRSRAARVLRALCCSLALVAVAACEEDPVVGPSAIVGTYAATAFTITPTGGTTRDVIADGGSIFLTLSSAGLTDGSLNIPPSGEQGVVITNLAGTWSVVGTTVDLNAANSTFLNDLPLQYTRGTLVGDQTISGTRYQVTLTRE